MLIEVENASIEVFRHTSASDGVGNCIDGPLRYVCLRFG